MNRRKEIDEWTHYLHEPDNNAVANDTVVGPPQHYQWIGSPDYLRHHDHLSGLSAMVSARGRLFYIMDLAGSETLAFQTAEKRSSLLGWAQPIRVSPNPSVLRVRGDNPY